jgi:cytochrome c553
MARATIIRSLRLPALVFAVLLLLWVALLSLERTSSPAPQLLKAQSAAVQKAATASTASSKSPTTSNGNTAHCTDGHGQDGNKNPHCRAGSQG